MWFIDCPHCGKQNIMESDEDPAKAQCIFCRQLLRKGAPMVAKIAISELNRETVEKVLPAVVKKPDTTGMKFGERNRVMHEFYEAHKEEILLWYQIKGASEMMKAWGIAYGLWGTAKVMGLRNRWLPDKFPMPDGKKPRKKEERVIPKTKTPCDGDKEVCKNCSVFLQYQAYQQGVRDVCGGGK
ncbi:MAG: hypothetical protein WC329_01885 [Candidatus Omnitrophota bacterium]|jgi:hypothetical protein